MRSIGQTDVGRLRANNQDAFVCGKLSDDVTFAVVCDGMGGANGGNVASTMAIRTISTRLIESYRHGMTVVSMQNALESAIAAANIEVYDAAMQDADLRGMGTTLVMAVVIGRDVLVAHIGDSRAYVITKDHCIEQLTTDHSVVQQMVERGQITAEEAKNHPRRNFITRALGVADTVACDFTEFVLPDGAMIVLCTDGLTGMVEAVDIETIVSLSKTADVPRRLIAAANRAGGSDNITVALIAEDIES
ncbi:MAG: Stp1/IreP family PP2C-type Ser/Thr phosphatase [Clostridia bacterium]|nr:Stp1/IreP family PP2C-type Ser/Thr phosphatase [Clostridia bacterium]